MTALTKARTPSKTIGQFFTYPVAAAKVLYKGALVCLNSSGYATPGAVSTSLIAVGVAEDTVDNTDGDNGDLNVLVHECVVAFENSAGGDEITIADIGSVCWIVDDQTVAKTSNSNTRSVAGFVRQVDGTDVFVQLVNTASADGDLVAANNLSDVASAATARSNIGANRLALTCSAADLRASSAAVYRIVAPRGGTISKIWTVLDDALATGNATITASINGTPVTSGVVTITEAGSAAGDVDSATPSAANTVVAGDVIELTVGGTNTANVSAMMSLDLTY